MWPVERPNIDAGQTFATCVSEIQDGELRRRLLSVQPAIEAAAADYEIKAEGGNLCLIVTANSVVGVVTTGE